MHVKSRVDTNLTEPTVGGHDLLSLVLKRGTQKGHVVDKMAGEERKE